MDENKKPLDPTSNIPESNPALESGSLPTPPVLDEKNKSNRKTLILVISLVIFLFIASVSVWAYFFIRDRKAALVSKNAANSSAENQTTVESAKQTGDIQSQMEYQLKLKMFEAGLSKEKVAQVHLGGYGVPAGTLEAIKAAIEEKVGVQVTIDSNYPETIPRDDSVYDKSRQQFDGDALWKTYSLSFQDKGNAERYLVVINEDMFTNIQPERPYIMSRSLPGTNNAVISVKRLMKYSDSSDQPASEERFRERVGKLAVRTLGVTVGLSLTPDADNINCLMYQTKNIDELDKVGQDFCETVKNSLEKVFDAHYFGKPVTFDEDMWQPVAYKTEDFNGALAYDPNYDPEKDEMLQFMDGLKKDIYEGAPMQ